MTAQTNIQSDNAALESIKELPVIEQKLLKSAIYNPEFFNIAKLSIPNQELVNKVTNNPHLYLSGAGVWKDQVALIYDTPDPKIKIGITDGYVEIVQQINSNTFLINGQKHYFQVTVEADEQDYGIRGTAIYEISNPGGSWTYHSAQWINVHAQNNFNTYTVGGLATLITFFFNPWAATVVGIATMLINSAFSNTSTARIWRTIRHQETGSPHYYYRRVIDHCYAINLQGNNVHLGAVTKYFMVVLW